MILNLFLFSISLILNTFNFNIKDNFLNFFILKIFIIYGILTFLYFMLLKEIKRNKIIDNFMKKYYIFNISLFIYNFINM